MKVLTIGTDRKLFENDSTVLLRALEYASKMEESHIIVFSLKNQNFQYKTTNNLHIYPTNSKSRLDYVFDAIKIGKKITKENNFIFGQSVISAQDPFETGLVGYFL